jgi:hypothetical protein
LAEGFVMSVNLLFEETENKMKIKTYLASSSIETGLMRTLIGDSCLAVGSSVAGRAAASVRPLSGVEAGGSVATGLVVGTVVEVLVAEEAAPPVVAVALPGFLAGPVLAAGISNTLIAKRSGPTTSTSEIAKNKGISNRKIF